MDVVASAITVASSALTLTITVTNIIRDIKRRDENIQELETKSKILGDIIREVQKGYNIREERRAALSTTPVDEKEIRILGGVNQIVESCKNDLQKYEEHLSKLRDRQNFIVQAYTERIARPDFKKIADSMDRHYIQLQLLVSLHHQYTSDAKFAAVLEDLNKIKIRLDILPEVQPNEQLTIQPAPLLRIDTERTLVNRFQDTGHEDQVETLDDGETLRDDDSLSMSHSPRQSNENGKLLLQAVKNGKLDALDSLLSNSGTNVEEADEKGRTPLILAANLGKAEMVNRLLANQSIKINATDNLGRTPLHYCANEKIMKPTIEVLLRRGADVNVQDRGFHPPMYYAINKDNYDTFEMLLEQPHANVDFELPTKPIPKRINSLINRHLTNGSMDSISELSKTPPKKGRTKSQGGPMEGKKSSFIRKWSNPDG